MIIHTLKHVHWGTEGIQSPCFLEHNREHLIFQHIEVSRESAITVHSRTLLLPVISSSTTNQKRR